MEYKNKYYIVLTLLIIAIISLLVLLYVSDYWRDKAEYICQVQEVQHSAISIQYDIIQNLEGRINWKNKEFGEEIRRDIQNMTIPGKIECEEYLYNAR